MTLYYNEIQSPVGTLKLVADDSTLRAVLWGKDRNHEARFASACRSKDHPILQAAERELAEYFVGKRTRFTVPLASCGTDFQRRVWRQLRRIPFGSHCTYGELARAIGQPLAVRAVGAACGRNPLSIVVPCHRVVGMNGALTGFAGGLKAKAHLIALEQRVAMGQPQ